MRVLLDQGVLEKHLPCHDVESVGSMGWKGTRNGKILAAVEAAGFEAMVTNDRRMETQQQLLRRPFAVLILSATNWPLIEPHLVSKDRGGGGRVQAGDRHKS